MVKWTVLFFGLLGFLSAPAMACGHGDKDGPKDDRSIIHSTDYSAVYSCSDKDKDKDRDKDRGY